MGEQSSGAIPASSSSRVAVLVMLSLWIVRKTSGNDGNFHVWAVNADVCGVGVQVWS